MSIILKLAALVLTNSYAPGIEEQAQTIVERTRKTQATYAAYLWGASSDVDGKSEETWGAEFRSGDWQRLEGPRLRALANCRTHEGYTFDVKSGKLANSPQAYHGVCGIFDAPDVRSVKRLPAVHTKYGVLDQIEIEDVKFRRRYAVDASGIIVQSDWQAIDGAAYPCIQTQAIAVLRNLPRADIFTAESLVDSVVAVRYRSVPVGFLGNGLTGRPCSVSH